MPARTTTVSWWSVLNLIFLLAASLYFLTPTSRVYCLHKFVTSSSVSPAPHHSVTFGALDWIARSDFGLSRSGCHSVIIRRPRSAGSEGSSRGLLASERCFTGARENFQGRVWLREVFYRSSCIYCCWGRKAQWSYSNIWVSSRSCPSISSFYHDSSSPAKVWKAERSMFYGCGIHSETLVCYRELQTWMMVIPQMAK